MPNPHENQLCPTRDPQTRVSQNFMGGPAIGESPCSVPYLYEWFFLPGSSNNALFQVGSTFKALYRLMDPPTLPPKNIHHQPYPPSIPNSTPSSLHNRRRRKNPDPVHLSSSHHPSHIYKHASTSSMRTRAAHVAQVAHIHNPSNKHIKKCYTSRLRRKAKKISKCIIQVNHSPSFHCPPPVLPSLLQTHHVVVDGGLPITPSLAEPPPEPPLPPLKSGKPRPPPKKWLSLRVSDLHVVDTKTLSKGLQYTLQGDDSFAFLRPPRKSTLAMTGWSKKDVCSDFLSSLNSARFAQKHKFKRGLHKAVYGDHKYFCLGVQASLNKAEIKQYSHQAEKMPPHQWNNLVFNMKQAEKVASSFLPTTEVSRIHHAQSCVSYPCIKTIPTKEDPVPTSCHMYGAISAGLNAHLSCHVDEDFNYSVAVVLKQHHTCSLEDHVVNYFCFPTLGLAVAMRPGDILIFNPCIPHCVSSRCSVDNDIYCLSLYIKTKVVGLNNNKLDLSPVQQFLAAHYKTLNKLRY